MLCWYSGPSFIFSGLVSCVLVVIGIFPPSIRVGMKMIDFVNLLSSFASGVREESTFP